MGQDAWTKCRILLFTKGWLVAFVTSTTSLESVATDSCTCAPTSLLGFELVDGHIWRPTRKRFWKVSRAIRRFLEPHRLVVAWNRWLTMLRSWSWFGANCWLTSPLSTTSSGSVRTSDSICGRLSLRTWALLPTAISDIGRNWSTSHVAYDASFAGFL